MFVTKLLFMLSSLRTFGHNINRSIITRRMSQLLEQMNATWQKGIESKELVVFQSYVSYVQDCNYSV